MLEINNIDTGVQQYDIKQLQKAEVSYERKDKGGYKINSFTYTDIKGNTFDLLGKINVGEKIRIDDESFKTILNYSGFLGEDISKLSKNDKIKIISDYLSLQVSDTNGNDGFTQWLSKKIAPFIVLAQLSTAIPSNVIASDVGNSTGIFADQVNNTLSPDAEIITTMNDIAGKDWAARRLSDGTQIKKEGDLFKIIYVNGEENIYVNTGGVYTKKNDDSMKFAQKLDGTMSFNPNPNGGTATYRNGDSVYSGSIGKSSQNGTSLNLGLATKLGNSSAVAVNIEGGANVQRFIGSLGFSFERGNLIFSGEHLGVKNKYTFTSGEVEEMVRQNKAGVALSIKLSDGILNSFVASGSITKAESKNLASKEVIIDNSTIFAIYENLRRIAGGTQKEATAGFVFKISDNTRLELKARYDELSFDTLYSNTDVKKSFGGDAKLTHKFNNGVIGNVSAGTGLMGNNYGAGLEIPAGNGYIGAVVKHRDTANGLPSDNFVGVTYRMEFGGKSPSKTNLFQTGKGADYSNIVNDVMTANETFKSHAILAKVDEKMKRILEIQKAGLPAGVDIVNQQGDLEVSNLNILGIAGITKDAGAYTNAGEFAVVGGKLRIITKNITQPVSGTNTYVVTTNNVGGGTADVTIVVAKGSVIITSVNIVVTAANIPGTIAQPTIESKTNSTVNTAPGAVSGMSNVRVELYSNAGLTTLVGTAANGDFTGLSASTTYYAVTVGDDVNETTGATETKRSTALTITTDAPTNIPGTIASPSLESKTNSTVNTAPGAVTGMSNVRVELYSNAGLTTLVGTAANGDFTGLAASTTYYAVTVGDDVNETTGATETKRSTALTITTDAPTPVEVPPVMGSIVNQTATSGSVYSLNVSSLVTLTNGDAVTIYTLTGTLPTGVAFNTTTGVLSGTPTQTGTFNLSVTASDNDGESNASAFSLTVNAAANTAPTISNITSTGSISLGDNITNIGVTIADDDASQVTWSLSVTGESGSFSTSSGTGNTLSGITFTPNAFHTGISIKATITDLGSGDTQVITIYSN